MQKDENICPTCGQKLREYKVGISPMMIKALIKLRQAVMAKNENRVHLLKDFSGAYKLTRHEWNNFTRLRFHALAAKVTDDPGYWLLTGRGADFLNGKVEIPREVWIRQNRVVDHSEDLIFVKDVIGTTPYMERREDIVYREYEATTPTQPTLL